MVYSSNNEIIHYESLNIMESKVQLCMQYKCLMQMLEILFSVQ